MIKIFGLFTKAYELHQHTKYTFILPEVKVP